MWGRISRIRETLSLSTCADSSTYTKKAKELNTDYPTHRWPAPLPNTLLTVDLPRHLKVDSVKKLFLSKPSIQVISLKLPQSPAHHNNNIFLLQTRLGLADTVSQGNFPMYLTCVLGSISLFTYFQKKKSIKKSIKSLCGVSKTVPIFFIFVNLPHIPKSSLVSFKLS